MTKSEKKSERKSEKSGRTIKKHSPIDLNAPITNDLDRVIARQQLASLLDSAKPHYEAATGKSSGGKRRKTRKHRRKSRKQ